MRDKALALLTTDLVERFGRRDDIAILCDPGPHPGTAFFAVLRAGGCVSYCDRPRPPEMLCAMAAEHVTGMLTTPWFLCLLEQALCNELARLPRYRRRFFRAALALSPLLPLATRRQLFRRLHRRFGGCHYAINGGAPLAGRTLRFFAAIGMPVYQVDRLPRMD